MKKKRKYVILSYMLIYSKLMLYFFSFYNFLFFRLLADAKMLKNILKHHIICHFPCNIRNKENALSYILRKKISGYMRVKPILHSMNSI